MSSSRPVAAPRSARVASLAAPWEMSIEAWLVVGLTIVAAGLRFAGLASQSYWLDESQAAHELGLSFGHMLSTWNVAEWNPPLYLIVAWPWARLFGTGEAGLRALSALLGCAVVPLLYLSGRELVSRRAGLAAAALAAVNPFMIWYSQEAREYMLLVALCAGSLLCFARAWNEPSRRRLAWWAAISALALLTQYFAGFLVAAEGLLLVYRARSRASVVALGSMAVVLAPFVPHVVPRFQTQAGFIVEQSLSARLQQVPVAFGLNTLYQSSAVSYGLLGAAALAAIVIALLVIGADGRELWGAGLAAAVAGFVLIVPLLLALVGHDDFIARGLMPAWPPLAVVIGAACAARRARAAGAVLACGLVALFVYGLVKIDSQPRYQRPDWRGVAAALGPATQPRAVVAYGGEFATGPLSFYLPGVAWAGPGAPHDVDAGPFQIRELDVIGSTAQTPSPHLPAGTTRLASRTVNGYEVDRFALRRPVTVTAPAAVAQAGRLLAPALPDSAVVFQPPAS